MRFVFILLVFIARLSVAIEASNSQEMETEILVIFSHVAMICLVPCHQFPRDEQDH